MACQPACARGQVASAIRPWACPGPSVLSPGCASLTPGPVHHRWQAPSASRKQLRQLLALPGLDFNARAPATGRTVLMLLAEGRRALLVGDLLAYAAAGRVDLEARDASGATALLLSARAGDGIALRALLDAGAGAVVGWGAPAAGAVLSWTETRCRSMHVQARTHSAAGRTTG